MIIEQYIFVFTVITFISLCVTSLITVLHRKTAFEPIQLLDFRTVAIELLTLTVWAKIILTVATEPKDGGSMFLNGFFLLLALILGVMLIRSTIKESKIRNDVRETQGRQKEISKRLRSLEQQRTDFLSLTSHQLRGPYASIKGHVSLISEGEYGEVPDNLKEPMRKLHESTRQLGFLINDFLDLAKIENGELDYRCTKTDITEVLHNAVSNFTDEFEKKGIELRQTFNLEDKIFVEVDPNRTQQALAKIIDNALKYTPSGYVQISIAEKKSEVIITLKDSGFGLEYDAMQKMFHKYTRAEDSTEAGTYGNGLGLYVAKEMIESQNGRIWVESPGKGKGSVFYIALPLAK